MERSKRILLGRGISNHPGLIDWIKKDLPSSVFTIYASHITPEAQCFQTCDEFILEPSIMTDNEYIDFIVGVCEKHSIDVFIAGRQFLNLDANRDRFEAAGTILLVPATGENLKTIEDKNLFYEKSKSFSVTGPDFIPYSTLEEFDSAYKKLSKQFEKLCTKPSVGIFASGFRVIYEELDPYKEFMNPSQFRISLDDIRTVWAMREHFHQQLLMECLPGDEWSIDCFRNSQGELWTIPRHKSWSGEQRIISDPKLTAICNELATEFDLKGLFNIQLKGDIDNLRILEINPRLSGGSGAGIITGINLPVLAITEALGINYNSEKTHDEFKFLKMESYKCTKCM